ncbi:MAG: hypothetical protein AAGE52_20630 [Myxococcota bacterium]
MPSLKPHRVLWLATLLSLASTAFAQEHVPMRIELPLDGTPVDLTGTLGPDRIIEVAGTITSAYDGAELDVFSRRAEGVRFEADGPFVFFPEGTEVLEQDPTTHRYRLQLPEHERPIVSFAIARLAARQLQTRSEAAAMLSGVLEVDVYGVPAAVTEAAEPKGAIASVDAGPSYAWGFLGLVPLGLLALFRRKRESWASWRKRAKRATKAIEREAARLGPAYDHVVETSRELCERAMLLERHAQAIGDAERRIEGKRSTAAARREELTQEARLARANMEALVQRLEGVAAELAAQVARHERVVDIDQISLAMSRELEIAVAADHEAR